MTGPVPAYRALPDRNGKFPLVLVVQEIFGVHEHIKDVCRRLAKLGYFAIAVELYHRQGDVTKFTDNQEIFAKVVNHRARQPGDVGPRCLGRLRRSPPARPTPRGSAITGFCWGGRITWTYCVHNPKVKAGVAWYGRLVAPQKAPLQPAYPDRARGRTSRCRCWVSTAAPTPASRSEHVDQMRAALKAAGNSSSEIVVYDGAPHAFYADYRPSYRKEAAEDGWRRMQEWFRKHGVA